MLIKIIILEDHPMTRDGYINKLKQATDLEIGYALAYGNDLEPTLSIYPADVLLLDLQVPTNEQNINPFPIWHTLSRIVEQYPSLAILVISMFNSPALIDTALKS